MINKIRKFTGSWVAKVMLAGVSLSFILFWGISDVFRRLTNSDKVVRLGGKSISIDDFHERYTKNSALLTKSLSERVDVNQIQSIILQYTISTSVNELLLDLLVEHYGLLFNDDVVRYMVSKDPRFLDDDGRFSDTKFNDFLKKNGIGEDLFISSLSNDGKALTIRVPLDLAYNLPSDIARLVKKAEDERRFVRIYKFPVNDIKNLDMPKEEVLIKFYEAKKEELFVVPEYRTVDLFTFNEKDIKSTTTDDEVKELYEKRKKDEGLEEPFDEVKKELRQEIEQDKNYNILSQATHELEDKVNSGKDYAEVLEKYKFLKHETAEFDSKGMSKVSKKAMAQSFADQVVVAAFDSTINDESSFADVGAGDWILVKLKSIDRSKILPFDSVEKSKVYNAWNTEQRAKKAKEQASSLVDKINNGEKDLGKVKSKDMDPLIRQDIAALPEGLNEDLFKQVFSLDVEKACFSKVGDEYVVAVLLKKESPDVSDEDLEAYSRYLRSSMADDLFVGVMNYYKSDNPVKLNMNLLRGKVSAAAIDGQAAED